MNINAIISTCDIAGITFALNGEKLVIKGKESIVMKMSPMLREHKEELRIYFSNQLQNVPAESGGHELAVVSTDLEERIAFIQSESGLPEAWAEAFARMDCMQRPISVSLKTWQHIINNTGLLLDNHIHDIIKHGWGVADIFGVHRNKPENRYDCMGLLAILGESRVVAVASDNITLQTGGGKTQEFYRAVIRNPAERVLIWQL